MKKQYLITQEQLDIIEHYMRMFELNASEIEELCSSEKDDIVYGYKLGKLHSHLKECQFGMSNLRYEIIEKQFNTDETN